MTFASPLAFALAAVAIPIVIFYILKVRLRRVQVSTNLFWKQIYDEKPPRSIWQYLRHLLSLLAQLLLVALLVLAVTNPSFSWQLLQARRIVLVIDNSASMRAADVTPTRLDAAIHAALETVNGLRFRDEMAIVLAGTEPEVVVGMSGHVPTLKRALESIEISDNPTDLRPAVALGQQLIGTHPQGQILVFTDGCTGPRDALSAVIKGQEIAPEKGPNNHEATVPPTADDTATAIAAPLAAVEYRVVGSEQTGNVGITQFQVRRSLIDPLGYEVLAIVNNASSHHITGRLELELDGVPVDVLPLELAPDGIFTRSLEKTSLEGGLLVARLTEIIAAVEVDESNAAQTLDKPVRDKPVRDKPVRDKPVLNGLVTDDRACAVLPSRQIQNVLIVTPGNLFLQKVFEANPLVRLTIQSEFPATWPTDGIVVLHQMIPDKLPGNSLFIVDPLDSSEAWSVGASIENPIITEQDEDSPLMTHVRLDNVLMPQAKQLAFVESPRVLAGAVSGEAVYAEVKRSGGKCLVLSVDINEGDLTFRTAFPIMVTNALGWFAGQTGELRESLATGAMNEIRLELTDNESGDDLRLRSPSGKSIRLPRKVSEEDPLVAIPPLSECGVWSIANGAAAEPMAELAVNLASAQESDLRVPMELIKSDSHALVAGMFTRPIWFYLAAAAWLLIVSEWWLYQRRMIT